MKRIIVFSAALIMLLLPSCKNKTKTEVHAGILFIIGGGSRTAAMLNELVNLSGIRDSGYMFILPMSSSEPDSAILWTRNDFSVTRIKNITGFNFRKGIEFPAEKLDSLKSAGLIYISGGDQSRFMEVALNTPVMDAIHEAYRGGAVIAGTSAGAAVMSKKMITGNQIKHPDQENGFLTIEAGNIEIKEGLGLLTDIIVDQHFIKRQRLNRLLAASIENPDQVCIGIDESTAIIVEGNFATVTGESQVIVIKNRGGEKTLNNDLLGQEGLNLSVYLPGQKFRLR